MGKNTKIKCLILWIVVFGFATIIFPVIAKKNTNEKKPEKPDIYYIVIERYPSAKALQKYWNVDNSRFIRFLQKKGFYVVEDAFCNYPRTAHSLCSSLNYQYLDCLTEKYGKNTSNIGVLLRGTFHKNNVVSFLKDRGYKYIHSGSWWYGSLKSDQEDININLSKESEFNSILKKNTLIYPFAEKIEKFSSRRLQWKRIYYKFDQISKIPYKKEPTFTFVHFLVTHSPYVLDKEGKFIEESEARKNGYRKCHIQAIIFTNKKLEELVTRLIDRSKNNKPVIILQADEGPWPEKYPEHQQHNRKWQDQSVEILQEKSSILNAIYLPGVDKDKILYKTITPVNTFRVIFNEYFDAQLPLLEDKIFYNTDTKHLFDFFEVTDKIKWD